MSDRDVQVVEDMLDFARRAERILAGRGCDEFLADEAALYAVRYCLQTVGECTKLLSGAAQSEMSGIPWRQIAGMRDRLAHGYASIADPVVHATVVEDIPLLTRTLDAWLRSRLQHPP